MNHCVPSWDLDDTDLLTPPPLSFPDKRRYPYADTPQLLMSDTEVAELTWENGTLALHGLRHPAIAKPVPKYPVTTTTAAWEKPGPSGTLESIINQATRGTHHHVPASRPPYGLPPLHHLPPTAADALVPCSERDDVPYPRKRPRVAEATGRNCASQGSCAPVAVVAEATGRNCAPTVVTLDTWEFTGADDAGCTANTASPEEVGFATTSASPGSQDENTSFEGGRPLTLDDHDSFCHSRGHSQRARVGEDRDDKVSKGETGRSTICVNRRRASAIHNQSERKRRDRINERMKTLQKLVPNSSKNSSKTDKASMLDEVIEYLKQLQAQVQVISRMSSMSPMMMPMPMAMAQYQMAMLANMTQMSQMGMGMGMGMMDLSPLGQPTHPAMPSMLHPSAFLHNLTGSSWDAANDRIQPPTVPVPAPIPAAAAVGPSLPDPFSAAFLSGPAQTQQPMGMDMFNRMAALYQLHQQAPPTIPKT